MSFSLHIAYWIVLNGVQRTEFSGEGMIKSADVSTLQFSTLISALLHRDITVHFDREMLHQWRIDSDILLNIKPGNLCLDEDVPGLNFKPDADIDPLALKIRNCECRAGCILIGQFGGRIARKALYIPILPIARLNNMWRDGLILPC